MEFKTYLTLATDPVKVKATGFAAPFADEPTIPTSDPISALWYDRSKRRKLYKESARPDVLALGEERLVPEVITSAPRKHAEVVVLSGTDAPHNRVLETFCMWLDLENIKEDPDLKVTLAMCPRHAAPSWLPFPLAEDGEYGYCVCNRSIEKLIISPYRRKEDPYPEAEVHLLAASLGFWICDPKGIPNRKRHPGDCWVGIFLEEPKDSLSSWDYALSWFNDLRIRDTLIHHAEKVRVGWYRVEPDLLRYVVHKATTQGNQILRRDLVLQCTLYSPGFLYANGVSLGLACRLAAKMTGSALLAGQGSNTEIPKWTFCSFENPKLGFTGRSLPPFLPMNEVYQRSRKALGTIVKRSNLIPGRIPLGCINRAEAILLLQQAKREEPPRPEIVVEDLAEVFGNLFFEEPEPEIPLKELSDPSNPEGCERYPLYGSAADGVFGRDGSTTQNEASWARESGWTLTLVDGSWRNTIEWLEVAAVIGVPHLGVHAAKFQDSPPLSEATVYAELNDYILTEQTEDLHRHYLTTLAPKPTEPSAPEEKEEREEQEEEDVDMTSTGEEHQSPQICYSPSSPGLPTLGTKSFHSSTNPFTTPSPFAGQFFLPAASLPHNECPSSPSYNPETPTHSPKTELAPSPRTAPGITDKGKSRELGAQAERTLVSDQNCWRPDSASTADDMYRTRNTLTVGQAAFEKADFWLQVARDFSAVAVAVMPVEVLDNYDPDEILKVHGSHALVTMSTADQEHVVRTLSRNARPLPKSTPKEPEKETAPLVKKTLPLPPKNEKEETRKGANAMVVEECLELSQVMDEHLERRPGPVESWETKPEKMSFVAKKPEYVLASRDWKGDFMPETNEINVEIGRNHKPVVPPNSAGYMAGVIFGGYPKVYSSDTGTMAATVAGRLTKKLAQSVPTLTAVVKGKPVIFHRITEKALFWPRDMKLVDVDFMSEDMAELQDCRDEVENISHRMKAASRQRVLKTLDAIVNGHCEWDMETQVINVFIKGDDKVAKAKGRLIQFVPTIVWVRVVLKFEALLKIIKSRRNWSWVDNFATWRRRDKVMKKRFVWTSGMTQKQLFFAINSWPEAEEGEVVFICGDDNTDSFGDSDGKDYDASQKDFFLHLQMKNLQLKGFSQKETDMIRYIHTRPRSGAGLTMKLKGPMMPSGAMWTLIVNTNGLEVFHRQVADVMSQCDSVEYSQAVVISGKLLGIDMEFTPAPCTNGLLFSGSEFLKHIFVPLKHKTKLHGTVTKLFPVQLPSRVFKWGCRNQQSIDATRPAMKEHIGSVCLGQESFLLEPFVTGPFVSRWKKYGKKEYIPGWTNIVKPASKSDILTLPGGVTPEQWKAACAEVMTARYATSRSELDQASALILKHAGEMGMYEGGLYARMVDRDYAGTFTS